MDCDEETLNKCCYKCTVQPIEDLSIYHNPANSTTVLWNKYQVFLYENLDFTATTRIFASEYQISEILLTNNFLLCIDGNGNVHVTVLKFKSSTQNQMKMAFQPRENNIKTFLQYTEDLILSLKYEYDTYFLCLHKLTADFKITKKTILVNNKNWPVTETKGCIMIKTLLNEEIFTELNRKTPERYQFIGRIGTDYDLVLISLDNAIYCCIFSPKIPAEEIELIQLYLCPSNVKNIEVTDSNYVVISLSMGTVIRLNLTNISAPPDIIHLNMAIEKLVAINDVLVYTDGVSLWKSENTFTEKLKLKDLTIKHVKDLSVYNNQIICTTYTKLIYIIPLNSGSFIDKEVSSAKVLIDNSDYLENIFVEIEKNNELVKTLNKEQNYILATALSNRQDVINNINLKIIVYDNFNKLQEKDVVFTEDLSQYFKSNIYIFLIRLMFDNTCQQIYNILSNVAEISTLNITIISNDSILKIICIELGSLKNINYIIPLPMENVSTDFYIEIKIISNIPRAFDGQNNKIILYKHTIILRSEHFICIPTDNYQFLKTPTESIKNLIVPANNNNKQTKDWSLYMKLPTNYKERFKNIDFSNENLNETKILYINQQFMNDEFLNSQNTIIFLIGSEKVTLEIVNDGFSEPMLKILSINLEKALDIRQFVWRIIYKDYAELENEKQLINWNFYATTEVNIVFPY